MMQNHQRALISIAPMVDVSTTHFRYFMRLITKQATIYTQMLHYNQILDFHQGELPYHPSQNPIVLQLGGCQPSKLADAAEIGVKYGYDEINLNVGCPSPRVQSGAFGACLMKEPELVYDCMKAMRQRIKGVPCTVKCRLGVDQFDSYEFVKDFVGRVSKDGNVDHFIVHARKAILKGLNPAQNRTVPPLWYDRVYKLKEDFPHLKFTINGGIKTIEQCHKILSAYDLQGCMLGRASYENPYQFIKVDSLIYGKNMGKPFRTREQIILEYADYLDHVQNSGYFNLTGPSNNEIVDNVLGMNIKQIKHHYVNPSVLVKPLINMYHGVKKSAPYRQLLSNPTRLKQEPLSDVVKEAVMLMEGKIQQNVGKLENELEAMQEKIQQLKIQ